MSKLRLSKESQKFLDDLNVYLFANGKNPSETDDIINELSIHLYESEQNGKSIENIIGKSPKMYMESLSNEMAVDYRTFTKYILLIIVGAFSIGIFPNLVEGALIYSTLEIIGYLVISGIVIAVIFFTFRFLATTNLSVKKQALIIGGAGILPLILFISLLYLNREIATPIIEFSNKGTLIIAIVAGIFIIGMSIWARTWMLIIVIAFLTLPDYIFTFTSFKNETQLILSTLVTFGGIFIYSYKLGKNRKA